MLPRGRIVSTTSYAAANEALPMSPGSSLAVARWISIIAHPLLLALVLVGVSAAKLQGVVKRRS